MHVPFCRLLAVTLHGQIHPEERYICANMYLHIAPSLTHDVIKWKHFPRYWTFVRGIHRSPVNSPHKGQWRGALMFSLICTRIDGWVNNGEAGDLRHHHVHYDVIVMTHRTRDAMITSLSRQNDVATPFWRFMTLILRHVSVG